MNRIFYLFFIAYFWLMESLEVKFGASGGNIAGSDAGSRTP